MLQVCFYIGTWRNGSASDFGSECLGSNPGAPTNKEMKTGHDTG